MNYFWPVTLMDFATIIAAIGTLLAMFLSLWVIYKQFKVIRITSIQFAEIITYSKATKQKHRDFKLQIHMHSLFSSEVELVAIAFETMDKNGMYLFGNLWTGSKILRPNFNNKILIDLEEPRYSSNYFPKIGYIYFVSKDNSSFRIKASQRILRDYTNYINNLDLESRIQMQETVDGGIQGIDLNLSTPMRFKLYKAHRRFVEHITKFYSQKTKR